MAAAAMTAPGLTAQLTCESFEESRRIYNGLPDESEQPPVDGYLSHCFRLIYKYGLHEYFGIHLLHSHCPIPDDAVLVGENYSGKICRRWARNTAAKDLAEPVHGYIFAAVSHDRFHPVEFQKGAAPNLGDHDVDSFLRELASYLIDNGLETALGLETLDPHSTARQPSHEVIFNGGGNVLVDASNAIKGYEPSRVTGWVAAVGEPRVLKGNSMHYIKDGKHIRFTDGKPLILEGIDDVERLLKTMT